MPLQLLTASLFHTQESPLRLSYLDNQKVSKQNQYVRTEIK